MPYTITETDSENLYLWSTIARTYWDDDTLFQVVTTFDDGRVRTDDYVNGALSSSRLEDTGDIAGWSMIEQQFNPFTGALDLRIITYDTGVTRTDSYLNGTLAETRQLDPLGTQSWDNIITQYDPFSGAMAVRITAYDDGVTRQELFSAGQRDRIVEEDIDDGSGGARSWTRIDTYYGASGQLAARITRYDNGTLREEIYSDGVRDRIVQTDLDDGSGGAFDWTRIETYFETSGDMVARVTNYDDGTLREEFYQNGVISEITRLDQSADGSAASWQGIQTFFSNGERVAQDTSFDDGLQRFEEFQNGLRTVTRETDNSADGSAHRFETRESFFDPRGDLAFRSTVFDNGVRRAEEFNAGLRVTTIESDEANAADWFQRGTFYDPQGRVSNMQTYFDNGVERVVIFEEGQRTGQVDQDVQNLFDWLARGIEFRPDGSRANFTEFDNGDILTILTIEGARAARVERDGDDSDPWLARITEYDATGQNGVVTTYDTFETVPAEYLDYVLGNQVMA